MSSLPTATGLSIQRLVSLNTARPLNEKNPRLIIEYRSRGDGRGLLFFFRRASCRATVVHLPDPLSPTFP